MARRTEREVKMEAYEQGIVIMQWLVGTVGAGACLVGIVLFFLSFGDAGTGEQRRNGIIAFLGGAAVIAIAVGIPSFFTQPPTL